MGIDAASTRDRILAIAEPIAAERSLEVLDLELGGTPSNRLVRVYLDTGTDERRVGVEDCQAVSQRLGDGLEAYEVLRGRYMLEVSSAGVNRPLKKPEHYQRVVGGKVRVRWQPAGEEARTVLGRLLEAGADGIRVQDDAGVEVAIAYPDVQKANFEFEFEKKPARPKRR